VTSTLHFGLLLGSYFFGVFFLKKEKKKKKKEAFMSFFRWAYPIFELNALVNCNMKIQN
jgi:hypothetical protein